MSGFKFQASFVEEMSPPPTDLSGLKHVFTSQVFVIPYPALQSKSAQSRKGLFPAEKVSVSLPPEACSCSVWNIVSLVLSMPGFWGADPRCLPLDNTSAVASQIQEAHAVGGWSYQWYGITLGMAPCRVNWSSCIGFFRHDTESHSTWQNWTPCIHGQYS